MSTVPGEGSPGLNEAAEEDVQDPAVAYPRWLIRFFTGAVLALGVGLVLIAASLVLPLPGVDLVGSLLCAGGSLSLAFSVLMGEDIRHQRQDG